MIFVLPLLVLFFVGDSTADDQYSCYAGPDTFGPNCFSGQNWLAGDDAMTITYHVDATSDATQLLCEALGAGQEAPDGENQQCTFGWYAIEDGNEIMWGANDASPGIRCKGVPFGTTFTWSYEQSDSTTNTCPPLFKNDDFAQSKKFALTFDTPTIVFMVCGSVVALALFLAAAIYFLRKKHRYQTLA